MKKANIPSPKIPPAFKTSFLLYIIAYLAKNTNKIVALLIGNNYTGTDNELPKCISDAEIVGQKLRNIGADVTILDINLQRLEYLDDIFGSRIQTLVSTDANIEREVKTADVVIGSVLIPGKAAPKLFKKK